MNTLRLRNVRTTTLLLLVGLGTALAGGGCSGGGGQMASPDGDFSGCAGDSRADTYAAGMMKVGKNGNLSAELVTSDPGPPIKGSMGARATSRRSRFSTEPAVRRSSTRSPSRARRLWYSRPKPS